MRNHGTHVVCNLGLGAALFLAPSVAQAEGIDSHASAFPSAQAELVTLARVPEESSNIGAQNYDRWASPSKSFVYPSSSGGYVRLEVDEGGPYLEEYDAQWDAVSFESLDASVYAPDSFLRGRPMIWGGFFEGSDSFYIVAGAANRQEDDSLPVIRVTRYTKEWEWVHSCEISGCNTTVPFDASSVSLVEVGDRVYLKTGHEMYTSSDGLNHQASMAFVFDKETMAPIAGETGVSNIGSTYGYVSHSFNQDLAVLDGSVYSLEHGDAYPRAVVIKRLESSAGKSYANVLDIAGTVGNNTTGVTTGGLESSSVRGTLLSVGNSVDQETFAAAGESDYGLARNVWLAVTDADTLESKNVWLTSYDAHATGSASTPQIVKVGEDRFLIVWENYRWESGSLVHTDTISYVFVDGSGEVLSEVFTHDGALSSCQPVADGGTIVWYVTGTHWSTSPLGYGYDTVPTFYLVDLLTGELSTRQAGAGSEADGSGYRGYSDVCSSDWYVTQGYFDYALDHGIMSGYADGTFGPSDPVSRAQVATVLWRMAGEPEADAAQFPDCDYSDQSFYGDAVTWARSTGVISGYDNGNFGPADSITREQLATMLYRYARNVAGVDVSSDGSALAALDGAEGVSQFAGDAMEWAVDRGILSGDMSLGYPRVLPQGTADRSQMAKMAVVFQRDVLG